MKGNKLKAGQFYKVLDNRLPGTNGNYHSFPIGAIVQSLENKVVKYQDIQTGLFLGEGFAEQKIFLRHIEETNSEGAAPHDRR